MNNGPLPGRPALTARAEDLLATMAAIGIMVLPLGEIVLRRLFSTGIPGSAPFTAHLTLIVGLVGAAIAAREGKLLTLATGTFLPEGLPRHVASVAAALVGAMVTTILALGGLRLLQVHRESAKEIALGVPVWVADLAFPVAFGLIALRLVWKCSPSPAGRAIAAAGIAAGWWLSQRPEILFDASPWPWIALLIGAAVLGMPIFALLGGCAVILFLIQGDSPANAVIGSYDQLTSTDLPAIPLFTLAGFLLAEGNASERLLRLFRAFFGWMPGGTAVVTAMLCAFFTMFTGGSGVTILALGGLLLPALLKDGYREKFSLGLVTASGSLGLLFPPALPLILYGIVAGVAIGDLFIGGLLPGMLMLGMIALLGIREGLASGSGRTPFTPGEAAAATLGGQVGTDDAGRDSGVASRRRHDGAVVGLRGALRARRAAVRSSGPEERLRRPARHERIDFARRRRPDHPGGRGRIHDLSHRRAGACDRWSNGRKATSTSQAMFLLALNGFLIIVGCLMDIFSAIVVVVPLIVPIAAVFAVDPVHLGIIFVANLELGYLTPPVGLNLFLSSYRFNKPVLAHRAGVAADAARARDRRAADYVCALAHARSAPVNDGHRRTQSSEYLCALR